MLILLLLSLLTVRVNQVKGFEPLTIKAHVTVIPDDSNREICVYRLNQDTDEDSLSCRTLEGANEPKTFWYEWKNLRAGRYVVVVEIRRAAMKPLETQTRFEVLGVD